MVTHFPNMVTNHPQDGQPPSPRRVTHHPKFDHEDSCPHGHPPTGVITFPSTVTHHFKDGQLDLEFDSSAAKLVNLVIILPKLVSSSVALPAELVLVKKSNIFSTVG